MRIRQSLFTLILLSLFSLQGCSPVLKVISAHYAKEFCSCFFVVGQNQKYCEGYVEEYIPVGGYEILQDAREIVATGLGHESKARFISEKYGCRLIQ